LRRLNWIGLLTLLVILISNRALAEENGVRKMPIPVLIYHSISIPTGKVPDPKLYISPHQFEDQLAKIIELGFTPVRVSDWINALDNKTILPKKPILLTFDDGYVDNYLNAYPILKKHKAKATFFVIANDISTKPGFMNWSELRELEQSGLIDVESHTLHHVHLGDVSPDTAKMELINSKQKLENELKKQILAVAYPYGSHTEKTKEIVKQSGYRLAFSTHWGHTILLQGKYDLHRYFVKQTTNIGKLLN
jgi:peptidoglycan/xylan/chitin deacetylase (PgdA/CDA1 family)